MDIKCNFSPNYNYKPHISEGIAFSAYRSVPLSKAGKSADIFVKRPDAVKSASGLSGLKGKILFVPKLIKNYAKNYVKNIKHTYEHKVIFGMIEKEIFGYNTIDSITHDADKMIMYILGFPKSFVSAYHRKHSCHHPESGKKMNLRSMLCDNIASSPEFKPEKKRSLREHYYTCKELQSVNGLEEYLKMYNFGENLNFAKIKADKGQRYNGARGIISGLKNLLCMFI